MILVALVTLPIDADNDFDDFVGFTNTPTSAATTTTAVNSSSSASASTATATSKPSSDLFADFANPGAVGGRYSL